MKLSEAAANYVAHKQSMGMRFRTEARTGTRDCAVIAGLFPFGQPVQPSLSK